MNQCESRVTTHRNCVARGQQPGSAKSLHILTRNDRFKGRRRRRRHTRKLNLNHVPLIFDASAITPCTPSHTDDLLKHDLFRFPRISSPCTPATSADGSASPVLEVRGRLQPYVLPSTDTGAVWRSRREYGGFCIYELLELWRWDDGWEQQQQWLEEQRATEEDTQDRNTRAPSRNGVLRYLGRVHHCDDRRDQKIISYVLTAM